MISKSYQNLVFKTVDDISRLNSLPEVSAVLAAAMTQLGFTSLGINGLPPVGEDTDPQILAETAPEGFRDLYIHERFYQVDHICACARAACEPFRYSEAPYDRRQSRAHRRFMEALHTFSMGKGLIVPIGRRASMPACIWLAGEDPDLHDDSIQATQLMTLFAASKAQALSGPRSSAPEASPLTSRERDVLRWISSGKTSWEISVILALSERAVNNIIADTMVKLDAVTRTQAVVNAIRRGEIDL
jgi:LuxR family quorum sensing-dependent transcriptional regulator